MIDYLLSALAPFSCLSCKRLGPLLCKRCTQQLIDSREEICAGCGDATERGLCESCASEWPIRDVRVFGDRGSVLKALIDEYKYSHARAAHRELADMAASLLPLHGRRKSSSIVLVPIPTMRSHVRERGYDHMALLAKRTARLAGYRYKPLLKRVSNSVQHVASRRTRISQAASAFAVRSPLNPALHYVVFDDITTTGASLKTAAMLLRNAGAQSISAIALARQPLTSRRGPVKRV